jgi:hypothetical protein
VLRILQVLSHLHTWCDNNVIFILQVMTLRFSQGQSHMASGEGPSPPTQVEKTLESTFSFFFVMLLGFELGALLDTLILKQCT